MQLLSSRKFLTTVIFILLVIVVFFFGKNLTSDTVQEKTTVIVVTKDNTASSTAALKSLISGNTSAKVNLEKNGISIGFASNEVNTLYDLSKDNIEKANSWMGTILSISMWVIAGATFILGLLVLLTWNYFDKAKDAQVTLDKVQQTLDDIIRTENKKLNDFMDFINQYAPNKSEGTHLTKEQVMQKAGGQREFAPVLFEGKGSPEVFALDNYGFFHWIRNEARLLAMGYSRSDVRYFDTELMNMVDRGEDIDPLLTE
jgi:hypothetical protein